MTEAEKQRQAVKNWIAKKNGKISPSEITDEMPILEQRLITSVQLMDLILFLENLSGRKIDVQSLKKGVFHDVNAIYENFLR